MYAYCCNFFFVHAPKNVCDINSRKEFKEDSNFIELVFLENNLKDITVRA